MCDSTHFCCTAVLCVWLLVSDRILFPYIANCAKFELFPFNSEHKRLSIAAAYRVDYMRLEEFVVSTALHANHRNSFISGQDILFQLKLHFKFVR